MIIFVVPCGVEHKSASAGGAITMFEPSGTLTTGDRYERRHSCSRRQHHRSSSPREVGLLTAEVEII